MKIDLRCPVEVRKCELTLFDRGLPRAYIQLFNLANAAVSSIEGVAHWLGNDGSEVEIRPFSVETPRAYALDLFAVHYEANRHRVPEFRCELSAFHDLCLPLFCVPRG